MTSDLNTFSSELINTDIISTKRTLPQRLRSTIRLMVALGFILNFVLICIITVAVFQFISKLVVKKIFLEKAGNFVYEIQEARRYVKN